MEERQSARDGSKELLRSKRGRLSSAQRRTACDFERQRKIGDAFNGYKFVDNIER